MGLAEVGRFRRRGAERHERAREGEKQRDIGRASEISQLGFPISPQKCKVSERLIHPTSFNFFVINCFFYDSLKKSNEAIEKAEIWFGNLLMMMMMMKIIVCEKEVCLLCAGGECEGFRERRGVRTLSAQLRDSISPNRRRRRKRSG